MLVDSIKEVDVCSSIRHTCTRRRHFGFRWQKYRSRSGGGKVATDARIIRSRCMNRVWRHANRDHTRNRGSFRCGCVSQFVPMNAVCVDVPVNKKNRTRTRQLMRTRNGGRKKRRKISAMVNSGVHKNVPMRHSQGVIRTAGGGIAATSSGQLNSHSYVRNDVCHACRSTATPHRTSIQQRYVVLFSNVDGSSGWSIANSGRWNCVW